MMNPTYTAPNEPCDWCDEPAERVVLDPFALNSHSLACDEHAAQHYGIVA